jgi:hypothetical protein
MKLRPPTYAHLPDPKCSFTCASCIYIRAGKAGRAGRFSSFYWCFRAVEIARWTGKKRGKIDGNTQGCKEFLLRTPGENG